jgi:hypothetical protein
MSSPPGNLAFGFRGTECGGRLATPFLRLHLRSESENNRALYKTTANHCAELQSIRKQLAKQVAMVSGARNSGHCTKLLRPAEQRSPRLQSIDLRCASCPYKPTLHRVRVNQTCLLELKATASEYGEVRDSLDVVP